MSTIIALFSETANLTDPEQAFRELGLPTDEVHADRLARFVTDNDAAPTSTRDVQSILAHLVALFDGFPWIATIARITDEFDPRSRRFEQSVGNWMFVDHAAAFGLSTQEGHVLRAFMENETDKFRGLVELLFDRNEPPTPAAV